MRRQLPAFYMGLFSSEKWPRHSRSGEVVKCYGVAILKAWRCPSVLVRPGPLPIDIPNATVGITHLVRGGIAQLHTISDTQNRQPKRVARRAAKVQNGTSSVPASALLCETRSLRVVIFHFPVSVRETLRSDTSSLSISCILCPCFPSVFLSSLLSLISDSKFTLCAYVDLSRWFGVV